MVRTVRDVLIFALENMGEKSFKKFRNKLNDWTIKEGYSKIPRGRLEKADPDDAVDLIRRYYKDDYGAELTLAVLDDINEKQVAEDLEKDLQTVTGSGSTQKPKDPQPTPEGPSQSQEEHFVDRHQVALKERITEVSGILDSLLAKKLVTEEQYDTIRSKGTPQEKMRELFLCIRSWGKPDKDDFYQVLKEKHGPLVRDLERCHMTRREPCMDGRKMLGATERLQDATWRLGGGHYVDLKWESLIEWMSPIDPFLDALLLHKLLTKEQCDKALVPSFDFNVEETIRSPQKASEIPGSPSGGHFVDLKRESLIQRMSLVDPVLDALLQESLLMQEQYDIVRSQPTTQEKMRQLYSYVRGWGTRDKDRFLNILQEHNGPLIRDLQDN
ncbi:apoptosis-associated speck-like protein containing a CARD [Hyperolius riggenbachi]|uniref:apoptosis-associated speck-like protein containing a CARD n=1 Tax=Hyperolius riggenbachi TaxID=752182 RepID=UPI0035A2F044